MAEAAPGVRFFLSCDDPLVQEALLGRYSGAVALQGKGGYNTVRGVQSAVVDSYLLASSGYIIGPAHSSFVELAVRLAGHTVPFENPLKEPALDTETMTSAPDPLLPARRASQRG